MRTKAKRRVKSASATESAVFPHSYAYNMRMIRLPQGPETPGAGLYSNHSLTLRVMSRAIKDAFDNWHWRGPLFSDVVLLIVGHSWPKGEYQLRKVIFRAVELASHSVDRVLDEDCFEGLFHQTQGASESPHRRLFGSIREVWLSTPEDLRSRLPFQYSADYGHLKPMTVHLEDLANVEYWSFMVRLYVHGEQSLASRRSEFPAAPTNCPTDAAEASNEAKSPSASQKAPVPISSCNQDFTIFIVGDSSPIRVKHTKSMILHHLNMERSLSDGWVSQAKLIGNANVSYPSLYQVFKKGRARIIYDKLIEVDEGLCRLRCPFQVRTSIEL